jgi:hypothetical protein
MSALSNWLPPLVEMSAYGGDWNRFEATVYEFFRADFIPSAPQFRGKRVGLKRHRNSFCLPCDMWQMR